MGTYCTFCRVAGPDNFNPPEHLPTCRYYPMEAKSRDKTIQQQAERIKELERQLSCRTDKLSFRGNTVSYIYDKAKCYGNQLALAGKILSEHNLMDEFEERWNRVGSTKELSELQQAEQIARLSRLLNDVMIHVPDSVEKIIKERLAAPPQKDEWTKSQRL